MRFRIIKQIQGKGIGTAATFYMENGQLWESDNRTEADQKAEQLTKDMAPVAERQRQSGVSSAHYKYTVFDRNGTRQY